MSRPPLDWFALLFGAYVGGLAVAVVGLVPGLAVIDRQAIAAGVVAFVGVVAVTATRGHLAVELARTDWNLAVIVAPFLILLGSFGVLGLDEAGLTSGILLLLAVAVLGLAVYVVGNRRLIERAREDDAVLVAWTAGSTARRRWVRRATFLTGGLAFIATGLVVHHPVAEIGPSIGGATIAFALFTGRAREYSVLPDGLYVQQTGTFAGQFVPWSRLTGYRVTDDALIVDRWIPLLAFTSRLEDVDDLDAVTEALERLLDGDGDSNYRN